MPRPRLGRGATRVEGLAEFQKALRSLGPDLPKELKALNRRVADIVVGAAEALGRAVGGPTAKAVSSLRASGQQRYAIVRIGSARIPFGWGAEFGAKRYTQFEPWRGNQWQDGGFGGGVGYAIHPAIRSEQGAIIDAYGDGIEELSRQAFPS